MLPHEEDWILEPKNAHPNAIALLTASYYWDCSDDNSPLGNDNGADILYLYSEAFSENPNLDPVAFLESVLESWEILIDDWSIVSEADIQLRVADAPHSISSSNDAAIALAFSMYILHGYVDARVYNMAITAVERESTNTLLKRWSSQKERSTRLSDFKEKLDNMQVASQ